MAPLLNVREAREGRMKDGVQAPGRVVRPCRPPRAPAACRRHEAREPLKSPSGASGDARVPSRFVPGRRALARRAQSGKRLWLAKPQPPWTASSDLGNHAVGPHAAPRPAWPARPDSSTVYVHHDGVGCGAWVASS